MLEAVLLPVLTRIPVGEPPLASIMPVVPMTTFSAAVSRVMAAPPPGSMTVSLKVRVPPPAAEVIVDPAWIRPPPKVTLLLSSTTTVGAPEPAPSFQIP